MLGAFFYGVILSIGLIIPLGVQNVFIFNQGVAQKSYIQAMPCVITAFLCDVLLIISAISGMSAVLLNLPYLKNIIFSIGVLFLIYMGLTIFRNNTIKNNQAKPLSIKEQIYFALSASLLNPHALLDTVAVIGINSAKFIGYEKISYTIACICVSFFWFVALSIAGHYFNKIDKTGRLILLINKVSAVIMWLIALYLVEQLLRLQLH